MENKTIHIKMFGGCQIRVGNAVINEQTHQSRKPWLLLEYLIYNHDRMVSSSELIQVLWNDGELTNPVNALKTLVLRSRKLLEPLGLPPQSLLSQKRGTYGWCPDTEFSLDTDEFRRLHAASGAPGISDDQKLELLMDALDLYLGDFLPKSSWDAWVIPICSEYHAQYLDAARTAIMLLTRKEDWKTLTELCSHAITVDAYNEEFHAQLIYSLFRTGRQQEALKQYHATETLFYNQFGITPSAKLMNLYKLIHDDQRKIITDLSTIQVSLQEEAFNSGAYFCETAVFRDIYQLERRAIERTGDSIFLCLLTLYEEEGSEAKSYFLKRAMEHLDEAIAASLRRGDVYTRYSVSQYLILLPSASYEDGDMVMNRIVRNYKKSYNRKELSLIYSLQPLLPDGD